MIQLLFELLVLPKIRGGHFGPVLHQFIQWNVGEASTVPPTPKLGLSEPIFEGEPPECLNH